MGPMKQIYIWLVFFSLSWFSLSAMYMDSNYRYMDPNHFMESYWEQPHSEVNPQYPDVSIDSYFAYPWQEQDAFANPDTSAVCEGYEPDYDMSTMMPMQPMGDPFFEYDQFNYHHHQQPVQEQVKDSYRLRVGDRLVMSVYGDKETRRFVFVDVTGCISYLFINCVPAVGKTIDEVRHEIEAQLKTYYRNPVLIVTAIDVTPDFYTIVGEVKNPGKKVLRGNATVLTALSEGRGFTTRIFRNQTLDLVDLEHSFLSRRGQIVPVDFERLVKFGDTSQDITLMPGDYIFMATSQLGRVYVLGEVQSVTTVEMIDTLSLAEALTYAGGLTIRSSSRVAVIRGSLGCPETFLIDINRILKGKACDFMLCPGDIVYVPPRKFTLLRQIIREGIFSFVSIFASLAGTSAFIAIQPNACNILTPIPIIGTGGVVTGVPVGGGGGFVGGVGGGL